MDLRRVDDTFEVHFFPDYKYKKILLYLTITYKIKNLNIEGFL